MSELDRLAKAAAGLVDAADAQREADLAIEEALRSLDRDESGAEALTWEQRSDELRRAAHEDSARALAAAASIGRHNPWPPRDGASELIKALRLGLGDVEPWLREIDGTDAAPRLCAEHERLGQEANKISSRLARLR